MKKSVWAGCVLASLFLCGETRGAGTDEGMLFVNIHGADRAALQQRFGAAARRVDLTEALGGTVRAGVPSTGLEGATSDVSIDASSLIPFRSGLFGKARSQTVIRLALDGRATEFGIVDVTFDSSFGVYHVAAIDLGSEDGYARFTVQEDDGLVVGTIYSDNLSWRITPEGRAGGHRMRRISDSTRSNLHDATNALSDPERLRKLEARHIQIMRIAEVQPHRFHMTDGGVLASISADEIVRLDLANAGSVSDAGRIEFDHNALAEALNAAIAQLRPLISLDEEMTVSIQSIQLANTGDSDAPGDLVIRFNQVVGGLAVEPGGLAVIDPHDGKMKAFTAPLVRATADIKDRHLWLDQRRALQIAQGALPSQLRGQPVRVSESQLKYAYRSENDVEPEWVFRVIVDEQPFTARVNALTGEARVHSNLLRAAKYYQRVCTAGGSPVFDCVPPAVMVMRDCCGERMLEGLSRCTPIAACSDPRLRSVWDTVEAVEDFYENAGGQPEGWIIDVVVDADVGTDGPFYNRDGNAIVMPAPGDPNYLPGVDPLDPAHKAAVIHEMIHDHQTRRGPDANSDLFAGSLAEGFADAVAGMMTNDWTLYDGTLQPQHERDLTTPRSLDEYPASADPHENGKIFGNMIYRLQQKPGVTVAGLSNLVLETYARVSPSRAGNPGEYDLADLYAVMDEIAVNNPVLREAISDVWAEMDGTEGAGSGDPGSGGPSGGVPPPPSAPRPPGYVDGYFKRCDSAETTVSVHQNYWQPVFGATSYDVYYRVLLGGTNYVYSFTEFGTSEETINTVDVSVRVKACNAFGCSWLSADDYVQLDLCGG